MRLLAATVMAVGLSSTPHQQVFRSGTVAIAVDVSVMSGRRPVVGLTSADFELLDNGRKQEIAVISQESQPLQIVLLCDSSASSYKRPLGTPYNFRDGSIQQWTQEVVAVTRAAAGSRDSLTSYSFGSQLSQTDCADRPPTSAEVQAKRARTSLLDSMAIVLMQAPKPEYRRVVVVVSDGRDTSSVIDERLLLDIADRSDGSIYLLAVGGRDPLSLPGISRQPVTSVDGYEWLLREFVDRTGGRLLKLLPSDDPSRTLTESFDQIRKRYTLVYAPRDVEQPGWHDIQVRITGKRTYRVSARRGYWRP